MIFYERPVSAGLLCKRSDMEKTLESQYIYKGKIINVRKDKVLLPDGKTTSREVVEHRGGVCVVPVDENGFSKGCIEDTKTRYQVVFAGGKIEFFVFRGMIFILLIMLIAHILAVRYEVNHRGG